MRCSLIVSFSAKNRHSAVQLLLEEGVDVKAEDEDRKTALHLASENRYSVAVQLSLEKERISRQRIKVEGQHYTGLK